MAKGQRISQKQIEVMRAYLAAGNSLSETARKMELPKSTVATWKKRFESEGAPAEGGSNEQARTQKGAGARVGGAKTFEEARTLEQGCALAEQEQRARQGRGQRTFEELRTFNQECFIADAGEIVGLSQRLVRQYLDYAIENRPKIERAIEVLCALGDRISPLELRACVKVLTELKLPDIGKLSSVMGTMYDKRALARGEPTENLGGTIKFEDL